MLSRKALAITALILVFVFGITIIAYPLIFNPASTTAPEAEPTNMPVAPPVN